MLDTIYFYQKKKKKNLKLSKKQAPPKYIIFNPSLGTIETHHGSSMPI